MVLDAVNKSKRFYVQDRMKAPVTVPPMMTIDPAMYEISFPQTILDDGFERFEEFVKYDLVCDS